MSTTKTMIDAERAAKANGTSTTTGEFSFTVNGVEFTAVALTRNIMWRRNGKRTSAAKVYAELDKAPR